MPIKLAQTNKEIKTTFNPFWSAAVVNEKNNWKNFKKFSAIFIKVIKVFIFIFLTIVGLWGCTQTLAQPWTGTNQVLGSGLEIGYKFGTTGDYRYDLISNNFGPYFTFSDYTLAYGPFYGWFVWPAAQIVLPIMYATRVPLGSGVEFGFNMILSLIVLLLLVRLITIVITLNSTLALEKMNEVQGKLAEINAKYKGAIDLQSKRNRQLEIMSLYKKHNIKSSAAFVQVFVTLPIFLIIYRIVTTLRPIKAIILFNFWDLSKVPLTEIFSNFTTTGWPFIIFLVIVLPVQFLSQKLPQVWASKRNENAKAHSQKSIEQLNKTKKMQLIFYFVFAAITAFSAAGVGVYWFLNALFTLLQSYLTHVFIVKRREKRKQNYSKLDLILERE
ncbi:membrane protein insertase YidC [Mycoplasmoides genitalium]|uniref:membrane protein insertase YidC n=1 Tax=Mycoplasmoides genitalium TaxID=2097 RepID=UPI004055783B